MSASDTIDFSLLKVHGSNNKFLLLDEDDISLDDAMRSQLSLMLHRKAHRLSTDGLLLVRSLDKQKPLIEMRMFNPDGSEAEMCGNGLRCVGRYAMQKLSCRQIHIKTAQSVLKVRQNGYIFNDVESFQSQIGPVEINIESMQYTNKLPDRPFIHRSVYALDRILDDQVRFSALRVPNPHFIGLSYQPYLHDKVSQAFKELKLAEYFPEGINLSVVSKMPNSDNAIFVVTCERGVGPTNSCGTAMAASSLVAAMMGFADGSKPIQVFNPGGFVVCQLPQNSSHRSPLGKITLSGNATWMARLKASFNRTTQRIRVKTQHQFSAECTRYEALAEFAQAQILHNFPTLKPPLNKVLGAATSSG